MRVLLVVELWLSTEPVFVSPPQGRFFKNQVLQDGNSIFIPFAQSSGQNVAGQKDFLFPDGALIKPGGGQ